MLQYKCIKTTFFFIDYSELNSCKSGAPTSSKIPQNLLILLFRCSEMLILLHPLPPPCFLFTFYFLSCAHTKNDLFSLQIKLIDVFFLQEMTHESHNILVWIGLNSLVLRLQRRAVQWHAGTHEQSFSQGRSTSVKRYRVCWHVLPKKRKKEHPLSKS